MRLDFNENTVGCSPRVIEALRSGSVGRLALYPEYGEAKAAIARYFQVAPENFVFTNGTDEAIQVFINTYVDDGQEVIVLKPAYAMYRFYAEVAGAKIVEIPYPPEMEFPLDDVLARHHPWRRAPFCWRTRIIPRARRFRSLRHRAHSAQGAPRRGADRRGIL